MTSSISYAVDADGIATLTIDQPGKSMNVIGPEFVDEFEAAIETRRRGRRREGRYRHSGKSSFVAGADLIGMGAASGQGPDRAAGGSPGRVVPPDRRAAQA